MKIAVIASRAAASGALVAAAGSFLAFFGPRVAPAYADIYAPLVVAAGFLPPPGAGPATRVGKVLVNGQTFQYSIGHSRLRLDDVLTHYEQQFEETGLATVQPVSTAARVQGTGAGVVAGVRFGPIKQPFDMPGRLQQFVSTKRLTSLGQFHVISAYTQPGQGTIFIDFTPGDDVHVDTLLPSTTADAPGEDLTGVRRPSGLQRLLTIEHGEGSAWSRTLIYRTHDSRRAVADFRSALATARWTPNPQVDSTALAHYTDGRRECLVGGAGFDASAVVILVQRVLSLR